MFLLKFNTHSSIKIIFIILSLLIISSCGSNDSSQEIRNMVVPNEYVDDSDLKDEIIPQHEDRKIVKEGDLRFETESTKETRTFVLQIVKESGGYIAKENVYDHKDKVEHQVVIRVPADKFDGLVEKISSFALKIDSKNINALDVTEEFIDVQARLKTKKDLEARYKEILNRANRVDEILNIEREIGKLRSEVESLEGRLNYLKNRVSMSSLSVTYYERTSSPFGFFSKFFRALENGWTYLLWFIIILTSLWPFILLTLIVLFIVLKVRRGNNRKTRIQK